MEVKIEERKLKKHEWKNVRPLEQNLKGQIYE
jgi:hypothetical protein